MIVDYETEQTQKQLQPQQQQTTSSAPQAPPESLSLSQSKKTIPVTTHQVIFPTEQNGEAKPYEFADVESAFAGVEFGPLAAKFKTEKVTPELWYKGGSEVFEKYFPQLRLTNVLANTPQHINLYVGLPGDSKQLEQMTIDHTHKRLLWGH